MQGYYENHRDDMRSAYAWYAHNDRCTPHFHNSIELSYVLDGMMRATLNGTEIDVLPNTLLINSSYTIHAYETPEQSSSIVAIIPMGVVPSARQLMGKKAFASSLYTDTDGSIATLMHQMAKNAGNALAMKGLCYAILGLLIERVGMVDARTNDRTAFIREVLEYLQLHHAEPLSVESLAAHFGYSRSRFSHLFNAHLGYTVSSYIGAVRCHHAARLLQETDMPVSDVAMAVGFESLRTFYRTFKKQYEMTPNRYAKT